MTYLGTIGTSNSSVVYCSTVPGMFICGSRVDYFLFQPRTTGAENWYLVRAVAALYCSYQLQNQIIVLLVNITLHNTTQHYKIQHSF